MEFKNYLDEFGKSIQNFGEDFHQSVENASNLIRESLKNGNKLLICGNGGSAADSQHFAAELVCRYKKERIALPAIALTTDSSILTAIANDYSYEEVFSRQVEALGNKGDVFIGITTSGNSPNVIKAARSAVEKGLATIVLTGREGGKIKGLSDCDIIVPMNQTEDIQHLHEMIIHYICKKIDEDYE